MGRGRVESLKKVSVVVPCHNAAKYLDKCLDYLLRQTIGIENMEVILVDDASTDHGETIELLLKYEQRFPETIIVVQLHENVRQGGARNKGIACASGEYLIFCDADDWLLEETLEHCYNAAVEQDADVVEFLGTNVNERDSIISLEQGTESKLIELNTEDKRKEFLLTVTEKFSYGSQTKLYRRTMLTENKIKFAEHVIFEEPSFVVPVRLYEKRHYFLDERLYVWYLSQGSTMRSDWEREHKWDNPQVWLKMIEDMEHRGFMQLYHQELEYQFLRWGLGLSLRMPLKKGCVLTKAELLFLKDMTLRLFPDICNNKYLKHMDNKLSRDRILVTFLQMKITDEMVEVVNEVMRQYL